MTDHGSHLLQCVLSNPTELSHQQVYADWLEDGERYEEATALREGRMLVDEDAVHAAASLIRCSFSPGSPDKRFVRDVLIGVADRLVRNLTVKQVAYLWKLVFRYRRQVMKLKGVFVAGVWFGPDVPSQLVKTAEFLVMGRGFPR